MGRLLAATVLLLTLAASAGAAAGRLGVVVVPFGSQDASVDALALGPEGTILAGGGTLAPQASTFALARLRANGALDRAFGAGGRVTSPFGDVSGITALAVEADGKVLAAGTSVGRTGSATAVLARYTAAGALDASFGSGGSVRGVGGVVALQPDGKIVTAAEFCGAPDCPLVRLLPDGSRDPSFGSNGSAPLPFGSAVGIAVQSDGKIVAAGAQCTSFCNFALERFTPAGALDTSFGTGGVAGPIRGFPASFAAGPDGSVALAGSSGGELGTPRLWRFRPDGSLLFTAATSGAVAIQRDGKVVVASSSGTAIMLARYLPNGSADPRFGRKGTVDTDLRAPTRIGAAAIDSRGRILVGGSIGATGVTSFLVARYTPKGRLDRTFGPGCTVPRVVGLTLAQARARIKSAGCRTGSVIRRSSPKAAGRVIAQTPKPRTRVELGGQIKLVVSR